MSLSIKKNIYIYIYWHKCSKSEKVADIPILGHYDYKSSFGANKNFAWVAKVEPQGDKYFNDDMVYTKLDF